MSVLGIDTEYRNVNEYWVLTLSIEMSNVFSEYCIEISYESLKTGW
jgi:hypothetical protein